jgi:hypothetical protein
MPLELQQAGWLAPNTWALEAFEGVFRRGDSLLLLGYCWGAQYLDCWVPDSWWPGVVANSATTLTLVKPLQPVLLWEQI